MTVRNGQRPAATPRDQRSLFVDSFRWLAEKQANTNEQVENLGYEELGKRYPRAQPGELSLSRRNNFRLDLLAKGKYLYLEPTPKSKKASSIQPVVGVDYDWSLPDRPNISLRVGLFGYSVEAPLAAIGIRFETPLDTKAPHNYHHAQLFSRFLKPAPGVELLPSCPPWLPDTFPGLPLPTNSPVGLVACLLISLYGTNYSGFTDVIGQQIWAALQPGYLASN